MLYGVAIIYAIAFAYTFEPPENMGSLHSISEGFLVIHIQTVYGKAILMCLIPILVGLYMMALSSLRHFKG